MKLSIFLKGFVSFFVLVFSTSAWALFPDKDVYPSKDNFGVYVGVGVGTSASNTFGMASKQDYVSLYAPSRTLEGGVAFANMGLRFYDFRFEGEYSNFYQWYSVINDQRLHTSAINSNTLPSRGQEALTGFAINAYYDMRFISEKFYPYIGIGAGKAGARYVWIDTELQPNGLGQAFSGNKDVTFTQLMVGLQYDLRIIKSSFSVEYRYMKGSSVRVEPSNDGLHDITNPSYEPGGTDSGFTTDWQAPVGRDITPTFHSVIFAIKYYLY
ncbi:MAG: hypothetical protein LBH40_06505 [Alphaproteobacteria bacterium]|jgi:hypothetical protein|nr:hypothetical protein [Alphaproteobacteria bacterium]